MTEPIRILAEHALTAPRSFLMTRPAAVQRRVGRELVRWAAEEPHPPGAHERGIELIEMSELDDKILEALEPDVELGAELVDEDATARMIAEGRAQLFAAAEEAVLARINVPPSR